MHAHAEKVDITSAHSVHDDGADPGDVELHARNVAFDWSDVPLHWIPEHPIASDFISVLNLLLPEGERWFVQTYNEALPLVRDEELAATMRGFIGQEAMHAEAHDHVLWEFLDHHGIDPRPYVRQMEWVFRKYSARWRRARQRTSRNTSSSVSG